MIFSELRHHGVAVVAAPLLEWNWSGCKNYERSEFSQALISSQECTHNCERQMLETIERTLN